MSSETAPQYPPPPAPPVYSSSTPAIRRGFWQHPLVQNLLPFITSLVFHLSIIIIGLLGYGAYQAATAPVREQVIVPEAAIVEGADVGGIPNPGLGSDPNMSGAQNVDPTVAESGNWAEKRSESLDTNLMGSGADDAKDSVIALGIHSGVAGSGTAGIGGSGGDVGGSLAPFGVPGGGQGVGPRSPFMGISGNARRVIYICDASGSMMDVMPRVKEELHKAIEVLSATQAFNVIVFSDVDVSALSKTGMVMATPDNKRKAFDFATKTYAAGSTDPLPAIRMAFSEKPELIYILTDGFENVVSLDAVIDEFRKLNADKKVKVNTILIRSSNSPELEKVLQTIANENGGRFKPVDRSRL